MTTTTDTIADQGMAVLKRDGQGRVRMPAARREQLLDEFERSGLSGPKFAALAGLKYQTFATWAQKRKRQREAAKVPAAMPESVKWLEAVVEQAHEAANRTGGASLVLQLPGGVRLEVADERQAALAAMVVRALAKPC
ncbi:MAG: IS66 family insertion sequence element accessory protein TnpB [Verrucomicrobiota bacterium]|nr:IS66 family insertion sequence element accessory protein TnpB [Verrucomicrobiota bacterium]